MEFKNIFNRAGDECAKVTPQSIAKISKKFLQYLTTGDCAYFYRTYLKTNRRGSILIVSIWMLLIFSIFAVGLYRISSSQMSLARRLEAIILSKHAAYAVCDYTTMEIENDQTVPDTLYELFTEKTWELGFAQAVSTIIDEESKININDMPQEVLSRLPGMNEDLASAIANSALKPFFAKEQLLLIEGMSQETLDQFREFITAHSSGKVNINTAPREVLKSIGFDDDLADIIIYFRGGEDGIEGTEDDRVFESVDGILSSLQSFTGLFEAQQIQLLNAISKNWLDVKGEDFSLNIKTTVLFKGAMEYDIILSGAKVINWTER